LDKISLLESFNTNLEQRKEELGKSFDESILDESSKSRAEQIIEANANMEGLTARREILQARLDAEDAETIQIGRKQLDIQAEQEKLSLTKEVYGTIQRRIQELEVESKRPARMSIPYNVTSDVVPNKKMKFTMAVIFGGMALGILLALLRSKLDVSLYTPDDVVKWVGSRVIGTTTCLDDIKRPFLPQQIADDYQSIQANLQLQDGGKIPDKVVIASAGVRDGKTTFAINLAISLVRVGKKVLLVDGDLRKPDVARMLNVPNGPNGLMDVLLGKRYENVVHYVPSKGFDILTVDAETTSDAFELISLPHIGKYLDIITEKYDHVIIDTPPLLALPDALIWAKLADAAILISFAGRTGQTDLKEAYKRLSQTGTNILGTVLNSVHTNYSYNRYGYGYYAKQNEDKDDHRNNRGTFLLPSE
jgi:capsular exopolysaccharide synthesis family protein